MSVFYDGNKDRRVIPNWRGYNQTLLLGELKTNPTRIENNGVLEMQSLDKLCNQYLSNKSLAYAGDLISAAFVQNVKDNNIVNDAVSFIIENNNLASDTLLSIASSLLGGRSSEHASLFEYDSIDAFFRYHNQYAYNNVIRNIRSRLRDEPRNAILWIELARYYHLIGKIEKAKKAMKTAIALSNENRFVIRSATRFYVQIDRKDIARQYLRKNRLTNYDPWVLSAAIALGITQNGSTNIVKKGKSLVRIDSTGSVNTTELASALGTIEFENGSQKKGINLFRHALLNANDNSLAQTEWASLHDSRLVVSREHYEKVLNPYEALAIDSYLSKDYDNSMLNIEKWFLDMPYTSGSVELGSFIASAIFEDYERAINICNAGLIANPKSPRIINNIAYAYAMLDQPQEAIKYINRIDYNEKNLEVEVKLSLIATTGLIEYKLNNLDRGRHLYEKVIGYAEDNEMDKYVINARGNQVLAEIAAKTEHVHKYFQLFLNSVANNDDDTINKLKLLVIRKEKEYRSSKL